MLLKRNSMSSMSIKFFDAPSDEVDVPFDIKTQILSHFYEFDFLFSKIIDNTIRLC